MRYNPNEPKELDGIIIDSGNDFSQAKRRRLLYVSLFTMFSYFGDIKLQEAAIIKGLPFANLKSVFFPTLLILTIYLLCAYTINAVPSFRSSLKSWDLVRRKAMGVGGKLRLGLKSKNITSSGRFYLWIFIEYLLPILVGIMALVFAILKIVR
jgi:hypothetical protein